MLNCWPTKLAALGSVELFEITSIVAPPARISITLTVPSPYLTSLAALLKDSNE